MLICLRERPAHAECPRGRSSCLNCLRPREKSVRREVRAGTITIDTSVPPRTILMPHAVLGPLMRYLHQFHDFSTAGATDGELLRRYASGDEAAFAELVR